MEYSVWNALAQSDGRRERLTEAAYASVCAVPALFDNAFLSCEEGGVQLGKVPKGGEERVYTLLLHSRRYAARTLMSCRPRHAQGSWLGAAWIGSWRDWGARRDERERYPSG